MKKIKRYGTLKLERTLRETETNMQNEEFYRDSGFSTSDIIGTVAAHEGEHGTNKKANSGFVSEEEAETKALKSEKKAIDDLKKRNNKASR